MSDYNSGMAFRLKAMGYSGIMVDFQSFKKFVIEISRWCSNQPCFVTILSMRRKHQMVEKKLHFRWKS